MDQQTTVRMVTPRDLWEIFCRNVWLILLLAAAGAAVLFAVERLLLPPRYESTATLYVLRQQEAAQGGRASDEFSLALSTINDCTYLLKSHAVLDQVKQELSLTEPYEQLRGRLSTSNPSGTRILEVTVRAESPEQAKRLVDCICQAGAGKIEEAMGVHIVNLYEYGVLEEEPCNRIGPLGYGIVSAAVAVLVYCGCLFRFVLKETARRS